jgi:hypothetical protein
MPDSGWQNYSNIMATLDKLVILLEQTDPNTLSQAQRSDIEYYIERYVARHVHRIKKGRENWTLLRRSDIRNGIVS